MANAQQDPRVLHAVQVLRDLGTTSAASVADFCGTHTQPFDRNGGPAHVTASCIVFSPTLDAVLLTHHAKARAWVQFGGHIEAEDADLRAAALREAREESGCEDFAWFSPVPLDVHTHDLSGSFGRCSRHHDVVYGALLATDTATQVSAESIDVAWFAVEELPEAVVPDLPVRLAHLRARLETLLHS